MKKLYSTFALALAVSLGASAQGYTFGSTAVELPEAQPVQLSEIVKSTQFVNTKANTLSTPAKANAISAITDICGVWFWDCLDGFAQTEEELVKSLALSVAKSIRPNTITIDGFYGSAKLSASVNLAEGTITLKAGQSLGTSSQYGAITLGITDVSDANETPLDEVTATYMNGTFVFPENILIGAKVNGGWFSGFFSNLMGTADLTEWVDAGTAVFEDGWGLTCFGESGSDYPVEVKLMADADLPTRYRLVNPYEGIFDTDEYTEVTSGSIVFDVTNPDFVMVDPRYPSGLDIVTAQTGMMYNNNAEGFFVIARDYTYEILNQEEVKAELGITEWSTFENNVANIRNCHFGIGTTPLGLYGWQTKEGESLEMESKITLQLSDGVNDILSNDTNAPVEYFNLQGVRVANPENGLYIRRQGNIATKVLVK